MCFVCNRMLNKQKKQIKMFSVCVAPPSLHRGWTALVTGLLHVCDDTQIIYIKWANSTRDLTWWNKILILQPAPLHHLLFSDGTARQPLMLHHVVNVWLCAWLCGCVWLQTPETVLYFSQECPFCRRRQGAGTDGKKTGWQHTTFLIGLNCLTDNCIGQSPSRGWLRRDYVRKNRSVTHRLMQMAGKNTVWCWGDQRKMAPFVDRRFS